MTTTMQLIAKQTVGADGAASVTFSNIPQTYTDLKVVASTRSSASSNGDSFRVYFNGDTGNINVREVRGSGSTSASYTVSYAQAGYTNDAATTTSTFNNAEVYIPNYRVSGIKKSSFADNVYEKNATDAFIVLSARNWSTTSAVTSITVKPNDGSFVEYSEVWLYGISNSTTTQATTVPYASGGDVITTDGSYWYHAFKYSGSFTPLRNLTADVLVVAGGGGCNNDSSGGGGAGGLLTFSAQALISATNYTCSVGAGGAYATNGGNSQFGALTATVGGGRAGGTVTSGNGASGGSGGGGYGGGSSTGGAGTSGQGNAGGAGYSSGSPYGGGGGGGAGATGNAGRGSSDGAGGIGATSSLINAMGAATVTGQLSGGNYYYAGGGGGNGGLGAVTTGGLGGGGQGGYSTDNSYAVSGTANTGGGAGGGNTANPRTGGSGIVIVRYPV